MKIKILKGASVAALSVAALSLSSGVRAELAVGIAEAKQAEIADEGVQDIAFLRPRPDLGLAGRLAS